MIEINPKIVAPNFLSFIYKNLKNSKNTKPISWAKWYLGVAIASFVTMCISPRQNFITMSIPIKIIWSLFFPLGFIFVVFLLLVPIFGIMLWPKKWIYEEGHVREIYGRNSTNIPYSSFIKIVMDKPYSAVLHFKNSSSFPAILTTSWYGNSKEDWLTFISFLRTQINDLDSKIGVVTGAGAQDPGTPCSADEAYDRIKLL